MQFGDRLFAVKVRRVFNKILIANRGEIALRIICACRELGIKTVAVYSEADEHALHVRFADEDVCIGPARSVDSYLNVPAIISAAEITGADAIHPGYGFLSESAYLAEVCEACHIKFIGPYPERHPADGRQGPRAPGDEEGRRAGPAGQRRPGAGRGRGDQGRQGAGLPGHHQGRRRRRRPRHARRPHPPTSCSKSLKTAMREAEAAFGVGDVYLEKYVESPRHIEIQVLGDHHGNVVHLGERECSIQRRHQKLIEEAPSVALTEKQRRQLGRHRRRRRPRGAVHQRRHVRVPAGPEAGTSTSSRSTRASRSSTRSPSSSPASTSSRSRFGSRPGGGCRFKQSDIEFRGHSIECRINAEDPETFVPSPGVIHAFSVPGGPGVRVDTFAHSECTVSPYYDSLIAKIITHGRDRREAIARMRRTLEMTVVDGIKTTIPLHLKILADPDFVAGRLSTSFMDRFMHGQEEGGRQAGRVRLGTSDIAPFLFARRLYADSRRRRGAGAESRSAAPARRLAGRGRPAGPDSREDAR